jgi:hypothetical protein
MQVASKLVCGMVAGLVWLAGSAHAESGTDEEVADRLLAEGESLAKSGDYTQALARFRDARAHAPTALADCFIGLAHARLDRWSEAHLVYERSQQRGATVLPSWCQRGGKLDLEITAKLRSGSFAAVEIQVEPMGARVRVEGLEEAQELVAPVTVWLALGTHAVTVEKSGYHPKERRVVLGSVSPRLVQVVLRRSEAPPASLPSERGAKGDLPTSPAPLVAPLQATTRRGPWPWVVASLSAAGLAVGIVFHIRAVEARAAAAELPAGAAFDEQLGTFERERVLALGGYAVSAVSAGFCAYLFSRPSEERAPSAHVFISPEGTMWVRGVF